MMPSFLSFTDANLEETLRLNEVPLAIRQAAEKVLVIFTQDWCPDWHAMAAFLPAYTDHVALYVVEYNRHPEFERIMLFKEEIWGNREIPYLRYYFRGELITTTNALPEGTFRALLQKTKPFGLT